MGHFRGRRLFAAHIRTRASQGRRAGLALLRCADVARCVAQGQPRRRARRCQKAIVGRTHAGPGGRWQCGEQRALGRARMARARDAWHAYAAVLSTHAHTRCCSFTDNVSARACCMPHTGAALCVDGPLVLAAEALEEHRLPLVCGPQLRARGEASAGRVRRQAERGCVRAAGGVVCRRRAPAWCENSSPCARS
jgi:hypothetical protein